jgi:hypothetical protein
MEATCSSENSDDFQRATRRHIPEDRTLQKICCVADLDMWATNAESLVFRTVAWSSFIK